VSAAAAVGVEVAFTGPDGAVRAHPAERMAAELAAVDRRRNQGAVVELVGTDLFGAGRPGGAAEIVDLLAALATRVRVRHIRPALTADQTAATPRLVRAAGELGAHSLRISVTDEVTVSWYDLQAVCAEAEAAGMAAELRLHVTRAGIDPHGPEALGRFATERGLSLRWTVAPGLARDVAHAVDAALRITEQTQRRRELAGSTAFARAVTGRYPPSAARPLDLLVTAEAAERISPARAAALDVVGLDTHVLHPAAGTDAAAATDPRGLRDLAGLEPGLVGMVAVGGDSPVEVVEYAEGRDVEPFGPTLLRLRDAEDVAAFLADADAAHAEGSFPRALLDRLAFLADTCAWRAAPCPSRRLPRLVLDLDEGDRPVLRTAPAGLPLAPADTPLADLRTAAARRSGAEAERRGCSTCPVQATCSADECLSAVLAPADYCAARRARPWLPAYLHALDALSLTGEPAGTISPMAPTGSMGSTDSSPFGEEHDVADTRVSGFGGPLVVSEWSDAGPEVPAQAPAQAPSDALAAAPAWPVHSGPVLLCQRGTYLLVDPDSGRRAAVGRDSAGIVEAAQIGGPAHAAAWLARERGVPAAMAGGVVRKVLTDLAARGLALPGFAHHHAVPRQQPAPRVDAAPRAEAVRQA